MHVICHQPGEGPAEPPPRRRLPALPRRRLYLGFALAAVGLPLLTWFLATVANQVELPGVLLLFLLLVVGVAATGGIWPALAAAVAGFLLVNWYFTPPFRTLSIRRTGDIAALLRLPGGRGRGERVRLDRVPACG